MQPHLAVHVLVLFGFNRLLLCAVVGKIFIVGYTLRVIFLLVQVHLSQFRLHCHLLLEAALLCCKHVHVAAALANNFASTLASLINFANSLHKKHLYTEKVTKKMAVKDLDLLFPLPALGGQFCCREA